MARHGKHDHLKPEILAKFQEGMSAAQVAKLYSEVPRPTVYRWFEEFGQNSDKFGQIRTTDSQSGSQDRTSSTPPRLTIVPPRREVEVLSPEVQADPEDEEGSRKTILWVRRQLIKEMKHPDAGEHGSRSAVLAQLANAVLRTVEVFHKIPAAALDDSDEVVNIDELSDAEITRRYQDKIRKSRIS